MKKEALMMAMRDSISEILEKMFFLPHDFPEAFEEREFWNSYNGDMLVSKLDFSGVCSGYFELLIPGRLAVSMAANFMGTEEHLVSREQVHDTVKEIINMVAGNTFSNFDSGPPVNLEIPEIVLSDNKPDGYDTGEEIFIAVNTLEYPLALKMIK